MKSARRLLAWYDRHARDLPWRGERDPYRIWVSEIMLQQTTVDAVRNRYREFVRRFPTLRDLAEAPPDAVMKAWEGMGYYSRAVNLHRSARIVWLGGGGAFPASEAEWRALPGVGPYTAAALACLVNKERVVAVDALVRRVLFRVFRIDALLSTLSIDREIRERGIDLIDPARPYDSLQALMDLATALCRPRSPDCPPCPLREDCASHAAGDADRLPKKANAVRKSVNVAVGLWIRGDSVFLQRRPEGGLFAGLWELPGGKVEPGESPAEAVVREFAEEIGRTVRATETLPVVRHAYTSFDVTLHPFVVRSSAPTPGGEHRRFVPLDRVTEYAQPAANGKIWRAWFAKNEKSDRILAIEMRGRE
ncbi:MAG: A/G-specific adenine glycosylase [Deltaproteobacteria bacterium]|nr:A/G-specific adenine glycosylase [Deltaproteobacteria bacterium]